MSGRMAAIFRMRTVALILVALMASAEAFTLPGLAGPVLRWRQRSREFPLAESAMDHGECNYPPREEFLITYSSG